jgi:hypothetical protein
MTERNYFKIGSKWGRNGNNYYDVMKNNKVIFYKDESIQIGDCAVIAKTRGYNISDIGVVCSMAQKMNTNPNLHSEFKSAIEEDYDGYFYNIEWIEVLENLTYQLQQGWCQINKYSQKALVSQIEKIISKYEHNKMENQIKELLLSSNNLILTGAPGTGKTYLTKQIAKQMIGVKTDEELEKSGQFAFVQFHPSYDYTDFVEGLRPTKPDENENIGFELKDGVFKDFCQRARMESVVGGVDNFEEAWLKLVQKISNDDFTEVHLISKRGTMRIELNEYGTGLANRTYEDDQYKKGSWISGKSKFFSKSQLYNVYKGLPGVPSGGHDNFRKAIINCMKESFGLKEYNVGKPSNSNKKFLFIIDEINRGEISKIFGELFFSIDPSYRGKAGAVKTQYSNLHDDENEMFYIPENIYIIGTMNDIDRSVESFDFAMRRRFTWIEITAKESQRMFDSEDWKNEAIKRMNNLNNAISKIEGLNSSYHIGGAYFKNNLPKYKDSEKWTKLWELHLRPLLFEYLRGMSNMAENLKELDDAYNS